MATLYLRLGIFSDQVFFIYWSSQAIILVAKALAVTELLRNVLNHYQGIWAMTWRLLMVAFGIVVVYVAAETRAGLAIAPGQQNLEWMVITMDRGFQMAFALALIASLVLVRHYALPIETVDKVLLSGFCFYACSGVICTTVLQVLYLHRYPGYSDISTMLGLMAFIAVQVSWALVLCKPLVAAGPRPPLLPISTYAQMSPSINTRLWLLNEQLGRFWKTDVPRR
ncbi:MAG TPA: hypothetical protein VGI16_07750 [Candidatus Acidoferrum sp.]